MGAAANFGVQSYCFRHFNDNREVVEKIKAIGVDTVEVSDAHADFNDPEGWKDIVKIYRDGGVGIVSIGVQNFVGEDAERDFFECTAIAGAKHISCLSRSTAIPRRFPRSEPGVASMGSGSASTATAVPTSVGSR